MSRQSRVSAPACRLRPLQLLSSRCQDRCRPKPHGSAGYRLWQALCELCSGKRWLPSDGSASNYFGVPLASRTSVAIHVVSMPYSCSLKKSVVSSFYVYLSAKQELQAAVSPVYSRQKSSATRPQLSIWC